MSSLGQTRPVGRNSCLSLYLPISNDYIDLSIAVNRQKIGHRQIFLPGPTTSCPNARVRLCTLKLLTTRATLPTIVRRPWAA